MLGIAVQDGSRDGPANRDILVQSNQGRVVVDPKSALFVSGSELDFSDDLQKGGSRFRIRMPSAHCSAARVFRIQLGWLFIL